MAITQNTYTGNGSTTDFSITFEYLKQADVKASLDGTATTAFTFANATTLSFTTAPANGVAIRIFRDTDVDTLKATFFPGSAIKAEDLNDNFTQNNFATQEAVFDVDTANATANTAKTTADTAIATANTADTNATNAVNTANTADTNASAAVSTANTASTNATNAVNTANTASTNASNAVTTANTADTNATAALNNSRESDGSGGFVSAITKANTAITTANSASTAASNAVTTANTASTNATNAVSTANSAASDATSAVSTANTASTNASTALSTANTASTNATAALNNSRESDGSGGYISAITKANTAITTANSATTTANTASTDASTAVTTANNAVATANAASSAVANAAFFAPIAALANLPSSPSNEDRVEVTNSTGVESSSAVSGVPTGFVGSSDLTVRLQYNSSTSKWVWQQYFATDPENRYATSYLPVIKGDGSASGQVGKITLNCSNNNHGVSIQSPPHSAGATYGLTLPTALPGSAGQALTSDTSGNLSFADLSTADGSITTAKLADDAVTAAKLADTAVTAGSYTAADITVDAQGRVTAAASGQISTSEIASNAVTSGKLATDSVTTAKIADDAVTADKLADTSVTAGSYTSASITVDAQGRITSATSGSSDKIIEGNTEAEVVDTGSDGHFKVTTEGSERVRVGSAGQIGIGGTNYGTSGQVLTSGGASAAPTWSSLPPAGGTVQATASGALTDGQLVALNTNGTVTAVTQTTVPAATSALTNAPFDAEHPAIIYYEQEDKYLLVASDRGDSGKGKCCSLTINSNGSYSFGTVTTFQSSGGNRNYALAYNGTDCVIILYMQSSTLKVNGASIASGGTNVNCGNNQNVEWSSSNINHCVSWHDQQPNGCFVGFYGSSSISSYWYSRYWTHGGNGSLTMSGEGNVTSSATNTNEYAQITSCWVKPSSTNGPDGYTFLAYYHNSNNALYATTLASVSLNGYGPSGFSNTRTVSSSSDSYGKVYLRSVYDETADKVVLMSANTGGTNYVHILENRGTNPSSGSNYTDWYIGSTRTSFSGGIDSRQNHGKIAYFRGLGQAVFVDNGGSIREISISGSGTSATSTVSSSVATNPSNTYSFYPQVSSDTAANNRVVIAQRIWDNPGYTNERTGIAHYSASYLTSNSASYLGISNAAYANGATATIQVVGSTDDAQSGLTPGSTYYVTPTGTLSTTAGSPSVHAGLALSATELIIKG